MRLKPLSSRLLILALVSSAAAPVFAADDSLRLFEREAQVVTASRRSQPAAEAPASVDVITREDIEASGVSNLCDLFRFRPGLDVIDGRNTGGSNRCVVSIRGFARDQVRELLVLIDGRRFYDPFSGTVLWQQIPVQLQDIERIEIVRGPNAALYGSDAGLGVINIITRAPKTRREASLGVTGGSRNARRTEESFDDPHGKFSYRLSHSYRAEDGYPTTAGTPSFDFLHSNKAAARAVWRPSPSTTLDVYAGGSWDTFGEPPGFGQDATQNPQGRFRTHFETLRLSHALDADDLLELSLTRYEQTGVVDPNPNGDPQATRLYVYDLEAVHSFGAWDGRLHTTWGGSFRYSTADSNFLFGDSHLQVNRIVRGFVQETAKVASRLTLIGGLSLESPYYIGTRHVDGQLAAVYGVAEDQNLRASYSLAHTNPGFADAKPNYSANQVTQIVPNPYLKSYELQNYEVGYTGAVLDKRLTLGSSLYYMKIRDHVNLETIAGDANTNTFPLVLQYDNSNYLIARGMELEAKARLGAGRSAYANYSQEVVTDRDAHTLYLKTTPRHIVNFGGIAALGGGVTASANAGWKGGYLGDSISNNTQTDIRPFWRLDARLAWSPVQDLELFVAGLNLLEARHLEFNDGLTIPRTFSGGVKARFR